MKILTAEYVLPISGEPVRDGAVAIDGERIVAVGTRRDIFEKFPLSERDDLGNAAILPGFVNCHSHLEITAMRGFLDSVEHDFYAWLITLTKTRGETLSDRDVEVAAVAGALEGARAGVTCFGDIGRYGRAGFDALKANGLRGIVFQETEFSPDDQTAPEDFEKLKDKFLALREDETPMVKAGLSPHSPYTVSPALFRLIAGYALEESVEISIHAAESREEDELMIKGTGFFADLHKRFGSTWESPGCSTVRYFSELGILLAKPLFAHCITASGDDLRLLAASGSRVAHCPKSNAKFGHGYAPFEQFLDNRIAVGLGSDSVASNNSCDILEEARFAALAARNRPGSKRFIGAREVLETATLGGAKALGLEREIGTLEAGKQADLIAISLDNIAQQPIHDVQTALVFASNARDVTMTMVAGREIYRDGESTMVDKAELKTKLGEMALRMHPAQ
jgi:5-methylthioadenosine/S-adenosylhomocysteine deaminase